MALDRVLEQIKMAVVLLCMWCQGWAQPESYWILLLWDKLGISDAQFVCSLVIYISACPRMEMLLSTLIQEEPIEFYFFPQEGYTYLTSSDVILQHGKCQLAFSILSIATPHCPCHLYIVLCRTLSQELPFPLQGDRICNCKPYNCIQVPALPLTKSYVTSSKLTHFSECIFICKTGILLCTLHSCCKDDKRQQKNMYKIFSRHSIHISSFLWKIL